MTGNAIIYLTGEAYWVRIAKPDEEYEIWTLDLTPDEKGWEKYGQYNLQQKIREDERGKFIKLRRPFTLTMNDETIKLDAPELFDADNKPFPAKKLIGNGSKVTVKCEVYPSKKGTGCRMESLRVDELVEYEGTPATVDEDINEPF